MAEQHGCETVELDRDRYILVCTCGWRSTPDHDAAIVGAEWDEHLADA